MIIVLAHPTKCEYKSILLAVHQALETSLNYRYGGSLWKTALAGSHYILTAGILRSSIITPQGGTLGIA